METKKIQCLSGSVLKLLAILTMVIDHWALIFVYEYDFMLQPLSGLGVTPYFILREIGRLAFPIFCFLAAEGYAHTGNRKKYALGLFAFALVSEVPFDLMVTGTYFNMGYQNVYFTLFLGVAAIYFYEQLSHEFGKLLMLLTVAVTAILLEVDYGIRGVLLIFLLYVLRQKPAAKTILAYPMLSGGWSAFAAFIPINLYSGKRGFIKGPWLKYSFYVFYPVHILVLLALR